MISQVDIKMIHLFIHFYFPYEIICNCFVVPSGKRFIQEKCHIKTEDENDITIHMFRCVHIADIR